MYVCACKACRHILYLRRTITLHITRMYVHTGTQCADMHTLRTSHNYMAHIHPSIPYIASVHSMHMAWHTYIHHPHEYVNTSIRKHTSIHTHIDTSTASHPSHPLRTSNSTSHTSHTSMMYIQSRICHVISALHVLLFVAHL